MALLQYWSGDMEKNPSPQINEAKDFGHSVDNSAVRLVTVHSVHSNLVKIHSISPSVMGFCPVCLGILSYTWQNTSRNITCEQLRLILVYHKILVFPI